jgi:hypothetical protein
VADDLAVHGAARRILNRDISTVALVRGSGNSRIYRVETESGECFALKWYFRDDRNRLGVEFGALEFLHAHGVRTVPCAIAADPVTGMAVYEFIEGAPALAGGPRSDDVEAALSFAGELRDLARQPDSATLPVASEACFSLRELSANLEERALRLERIADDTDTDRALHTFLQERFRPALRAELERAEGRLRAVGVSVDEAVAAECRTLSPSDFGFHNAIRTARGLVWVDFEYFGWDDPAKLAADYVAV